MVEKVNPIPRELLDLIPLFNGDKRQLNLFIRKSEYVIERYNGDEAQNLYVFHAITSRLKDEAAALLSEREDITHWSQLKSLFEQHFGDPRTEDCINIELESVKIKQDENYLDFCHRIQSIKSALLSKVNMLPDINLKRAKATIYDNTALKVFLYNLPEQLVRVVRLKAPSTLEDALGVVLEEVNFHEQYSKRNCIHNSQNVTKPIYSIPQTFKFGNSPQPSGFRMPPPVQNKFNSNHPVLPQSSSQNFGFRPQLSYRPPFNNQLGYRPPQVGYRPQFGSNPQIGYRPQFGNSPQFGYRPQFGNNQPQPLGYRPNLGMTPQQFGYKPTQINKPQFQASDVTMRSVPPRPREGFKLNELTGDDYQDQYYDYYCDNDFNQMYDYEEDIPLDYNVETFNDGTTDGYETTSQTDLTQPHANANFTKEASVVEKK